MRRPGIACGLLSVCVAAAGARPGGAAQVTLFEQRTAFQHLRVVEDTERGERLLCTGRCDYVHGSMVLARPESLALDYMRVALVGLAFLEGPPRRLLFIGMGIGAMPRYVAARYPEAAIDIVEIDPAVPPVAERFFFFRRTARLRVVIADGVRFVRTARTLYDIAFVDASFGPETPEALTRPRFFRDARRRLRPGGVLVVNSVPPVLDPRARTVLAALADEFPLVATFATASPSNVIVVAGDLRDPDAARLLARARTITADRKFDYDLAAVVEQRLSWDARTRERQPEPGERSVAPGVPASGQRAVGR